MTTTTRKFTFEEYLAYDDGTNTRYELVDGDLVPMGIGTGLHGAIAEFLTEQFKATAQQAQQPWTAKDMRIGIRSPRGSRWDGVADHRNDFLRSREMTPGGQFYAMPLVPLF